MIGRYSNRRRSDIDAVAPPALSTPCLSDMTSLERRPSSTIDRTGDSEQPQSGSTPSILAVMSVYLGATVQGLSLVSFAASGPTLRSAQHLSDSQFGLIFLPQVFATIIGALIGAALERQLGMKRLLWIALIFDALSQVGLGSVAHVSNAMALPLLLASTTAMGVGFGFMGSPMNGCPALFFPTRVGAATVGIHCFNGSGLIFGPLLLQVALGHGQYAFYPYSQAAIALVCALLSFIAPFPPENPRSVSEGTTETPPWRAGEFWILAFIAVIYSFAEGTFSNWAAVYLQSDRHLPAALAAWAISAFWGGVVGGRLIVSLAVLWLSERLVWRTLPLVMIAAFWLLPMANTPFLGIGIFIVAGLGCSAFFPLTVSLATRQFPQHLAWASAMMIAALMTGNGLGSFSLGLLHAHLTFANLYRASALYPALALLLTFAVRPGQASITSRPPH